MSEYTNDPGKIIGECIAVSAVLYVGFVIVEETVKLAIQNSPSFGWFMLACMLIASMVIFLKDAKTLAFGGIAVSVGTALGYYLFTPNLLLPLMVVAILLLLASVYSKMQNRY